MTAKALDDTGFTQSGILTSNDSGAFLHVVTGGNSRSTQLGWLANVSTDWQATLVDTGLDITPFMYTVLDDTGGTTALTTLGFSSIGRNFATDTGVSTNLTNLGITSFIQTVLDDTGATTARSTLGVAIGTNVQAYDSGLISANTTDTLSVGYSTEVYSAGTFDTGVGAGTYTPNEANGGFQSAVNGGPHTLAPPTNNCSVVIQYSNEAAPGTVTTSGFTITSGDSFTTDTGSDFMVYITKNNGFSHLHVQALQ